MMVTATGCARSPRCVQSEQAAMKRLILVGVVCAVVGLTIGAVLGLTVSDDHADEVSRLTQDLKSEQVKTAALTYVVEKLRIEREEMIQRTKPADAAKSSP